MKKLILGISLVLLSSVALAGSGGEGDNNDCNGQGNPSSPCQNSGTTPGNGSWQTQDQAQHQGQFQGQAQVATAISANSNVNTNANSNANSNVNNNESFSSSNSAVGNVNASIASDAVNVTYREARNAPSMAQGSFAISGCSVGGNAGGSNTNGSAFLGFGWTPQECYKFMLAQAYQSLGERKAVCDILRNTKVGKQLEADGIKLPDCYPPGYVAPVVEEPAVVVTATPAACETECVTKEEVAETVDRAFKATLEEK